MNLDEFIITCFCLIDEMIPMITKDQRLRARGPVPKLADSEVITMEVIGSYLGLSQDHELFDYFQRHYTHFFPALDGPHRTMLMDTRNDRWRRIILAAHVMKRSDEYSVCAKRQT